MHGWQKKTGRNISIVQMRQLNAKSETHKMHNFAKYEDKQGRNDILRSKMLPEDKSILHDSWAVCVFWKL